MRADDAATGAARSRDLVDNLRPVVVNHPAHRLANAAIETIKQLAGDTLNLQRLQHPPAARHAAAAAAPASERIVRACERFWSRRPSTGNARPRRKGRYDGYETGLEVHDGPSRGDVVPMRIEQLSLPSTPSGTWLGTVSDAYAKLHATFLETLVCEPDPEHLARIRSHEDPALRRRDERGFSLRVALAARLWPANLIRVVSRNCSGEVILTFATYKGLDDQGNARLRLVWDMRRANMFFRPPAKIETQASPEAFACAEILNPEPDSEIVFDAFGGDLQDMYYGLELETEPCDRPLDRPSICEWLCIGVTFGELMRYLGQDCEPGLRDLPLAANVVLMGWSWGAFFAQDALEGCLTRANIPGRMVHGKAPALLEPEPAAMLSFGFIDDYGGFTPWAGAPRAPPGTRTHTPLRTARRPTRLPPPRSVWKPSLRASD